MTAKPLTKLEKAWLIKLQTVLNECPSERLGGYTIGDPFICIYDRTLEIKINSHLDSVGGEFGNAVEAVDAELFTIKTPFAIHSTAG